jgi:hypothetical protein
VGRPGDEHEQEADRVADAVVRFPDARPLIGSLPPVPGGAGAIQRKCPGCERGEDERRAPVGGLTLSPEDETDVLGGASRGAARGEAAVRLPGGGQPLAAATRQFFEARLGHDFSRVRVHTDARAARAAAALGATAFARGHDIAFAAAEYAPETTEGRRLLAHELTHVVQQGAAPPLTTADGASPVSRLRSPSDVSEVQCDLATVPPHTDAVAGPLSEVQVQDAIRFNQLRFKDPYDIATVRDVLGLDKYPAVIDEAFVLAVVQWQAEQGLFQDGKMGADTTRPLLRELRAEGQRRKANLLATDNYVITSDLVAPTFNLCPRAAGRRSFQWDVAFDTSLRSGFIIQQVDTVFDAVHCDGTAYVGPRPTPRYWEAWQVDNAGDVTPTGPDGTTNDMWRVDYCDAAHGPPRCANKDSRGRWSRGGTTFTVLALPAAAGFAAGAVPDAGILQSTLVAPDADVVGLAAGRRRIGAEWNCCAPNNFHRRA